MAWLGCRYKRKKQSLTPPSVFEVVAVLGIVKCDSSKTTSFSSTINCQIILISCTYLSRGDALEYWKFWTTARLK